MFLVTLLLVYVISFTDDGDSGSPKRLFLFMHTHVNKNGFKNSSACFQFCFVLLSSFGK